MLSPDGTSPKRAAPSIWSLDSGYQSNSLFSTSLEELALSQPFGTIPNPPSGYLQSPIEEYRDAPLGGAWDARGGEQFHAQRQQLSLDPITTKLGVSTTKDSFDNNFFLPELERDGENCLACEFWKITNPDGNVRCEDCRIPNIMEPALIVFAHSSSKGEDFVLPEKGRGKGLDTSDLAARCSACELSTLIDPTGPSSCQSCSPNPGLLSPISPASSEYKVRRSRAGRNSKLPLRALNQLQAWLDANQDNPYPSAEEKRQLAQECGITEKQVTCWFTNARARQLNPLDTWLSSGSEDDGAHESDIASAADTPAYSTGFSFLSENHAPGYRRAGSVSGSSAFSAGNTRPQPSRRGKKKNYRRTNQPAQIAELSSPTLRSPASQPRGKNVATQSDQEMWQCTFCRQRLVPKSWRRHEETQHLPKAEWTCMLTGPRLLRSNSLSNSSSCCAFCMAKNPSEDHFSTHHRIAECAKRAIGDRTFYRPDHLRQHVKNFHGATLYDIVQGRWKRAAEKAENIHHTCGFCGTWLESWDRRESHIAGHFKDGCTMETWIEPEVWEKKKRGDGSGETYEDMDVDFGGEKRKEKKKDKERDVKEKDKHDKHSSGLARLSRTFSRRSTRKFDTPTASQPHSQPSSLFANAFAPIPVSLPTNTPLSYAPNHVYSAPPVLPDINLDPLMNVDNGYGNMFDWGQLHTGNGGMGMVTDVDVNTQFVTAAYDPDFERAMAMVEYGNLVDNHGNGHGCGQGGWGQGGV
ncbi:hypothetical protein K505DRAFT_322107 [Melanomma pulvis-pyrius CBS 109.77]|uniref:Homeobox domain-containing protein n=1 Tax=Melanomma pulvis-pyrius CBS 109.77 TaxID=1314802 RepID=A0A6A6XPB0_9PLEO|nr:hypothetical protein K505DRAFT_322107 [Melanomma pulvis-pyrius CBS 109.77]